MGHCVRQHLTDQVGFNTIIDHRFKTNRITLFLITKMQEQTAAPIALLSNLLRKGTKNFPSTQAFHQYLNELYGAYADCNIQKRADSQILSLSIVGIDDRFTLENEELLKLMTNTLCDMLLDPILQDGCFTDKDVALEKETLIDAIQAEINDKRTYALARSNRLLCHGEPAGLSKYGSIEQVKALTTQSVTDAYHELLKTAHIEVFFTGTGDADLTKEIVDNRLASIQRKPMSFCYATPHTPCDQPIEEIERIDVAQSKMVLGFSTGALDTPQQMAAMQLMVAVLGGTPMSKLFLNVREKLSLCYYCAARLDAVKGILKIDSGVEEQNVQKARVEILRQLDEMKQGNFTTEEVSHALMSLENSYRTTNDSNGALEGYYFGQVLQQSMFTPEEKAHMLHQVTRQQLIDAANHVSFELYYLLTGEEK